MDTLEIKKNEITGASHSILNVWLQDKAAVDGKAAKPVDDNYQLNWICYPEDIKMRLALADGDEKIVSRELIDEFRESNIDKLVSLYQKTTKEKVDKMIVLIDTYIYKCISSFVSNRQNH